MGLWEFCFSKFRYPNYQFDDLFDGCHYVFSRKYFVIWEWLLPGSNLIKKKLLTTSSNIIFTFYLYRMAYGCSSFYDFGPDLLLLGAHNFINAFGEVAFELCLPPPVADADALCTAQWPQNFLLVPLCCRIRRPVLASWLDVVPQFQLPFLVVRIRCHCHDYLSSRNCIFLQGISLHSSFFLSSSFFQAYLNYALFYSLRMPKRRWNTRRKTATWWCKCKPPTAAKSTSKHNLNNDTKSLLITIPSVHYLPHNFSYCF